MHINRKWENNWVKSDHTAPKKLFTPLRGLKSLLSAKAKFRGTEAIRTIRHEYIHGKFSGVTGEIRFVESLFCLVAWTAPEQSKT